MDEINNKTFIGVYYNDADLLDKIEELKETGYLDDNIYVIAKNETDVAMLRSRTAADVHSAYDTWTDRFIGFLTGENHVKQMMYGVGMDTIQVDRYYEEVQHGGMLLYVDEGWAFSVYSKDEPFYTDGLSPSASKPVSDPRRTADPLIDDTVSKAKNAEDMEPSYGGYEPLQNSAHPEMRTSANQAETVASDDITSATEDPVLSDSITDDEPPSSARH
ncbi:hypothetical protein SporoP37_12780 [Sporosarcina sp. P37]|uniref:general stress protein n=1 Tax=unclassified Sporosarcina TaxID=2647733 RepID=UPI0009BEC9BB|nr:MULTISPECIES: general stress protein [unclassified Sporosarcina]ARD48960.1 hypothetical protein SporoP33_12450 [Sporosarcina sp. P33]ARK25445.1 hypothetical protein SporoP37_12780 [Sporosarcina sp. P37]PID19001.1 hypothetical protein CSV62_05190 [Sporosarcina sp. P35]